MKVYLLKDLVGNDGYYGDVIEVVSIHRSREAAEAAKVEEIARRKKETADWILRQYGGPASYPEVWGGAEGAAEYIAGQGKNLFIEEHEVQ